MKLFFNISILILAFSTLGAQNKVQVMDENNNIISFVTISFIDSTSSFKAYSDINGVVLIDNDLNFDSVGFSHVSHRDTLIAKEQLSDTIILRAKIYELPAVSVSSSPHKRNISLGVRQRIRSASISGNSGYEIITLFKNDEFEDWNVSEFVFHSMKMKGAHRGYFRIVLYENNNGIPAKRIPIDNLHFIDSDSKKRSSIDISSYYVRFPTSGIFAGIEWLGNDSIQDSDLWVDHFSRVIKSNFYNKPQDHPSFVRFKLLDDKWVRIDNGKNPLGDYIIPTFQLILSGN